MSNQVSILTVSFNSWRYLLLNYNLLQKLGFSDVKWIIVNNTPELNINSPAYNYLSNRPNVLILDGIEKHILKKNLNITQAEGSFHHGFALNKGVRYCSTRYLIIMDPDFYVIRQNWLSDVLNYVDVKQQIFFGVTWIPRYTSALSTKWDDFPSAHFNLIDTNFVDLNRINLMPRYDELIQQDTGCYLRQLALSQYKPSEWTLLDSTSKNIFFGSQPLYFPSSPPKIKFKGSNVGYSGFRKILSLMDFFLWDQERFAIHMRNLPKGISNPDLLSEHASNYLIDCMSYLLFDTFI